MSTFAMIVLSLLVVGFVAAIWLFLMLLFVLVCGITVFAALFLLGMSFGIFSQLFMSDD